MPDDIVGELHVFHDEPGSSALLIPYRQQHREPVLGFLPVIFEYIAIDQHATRVLQLEDILDGPRGSSVTGLTRFHRLWFGHKIARTSMSAGTRSSNRRIAATEDDVFPGTFEIVVLILNGPALPNP